MKTVRLLCAYNKDEMLGNWVGRAEDWCADPRNHGVYDDFTRDMMELNAKIILTVWASAPITNYAARQYDGLMEDYYEAMWGELTEKIKASFAKGEAPEPSLGGKRCYEIGWSFSTSREALSPHAPVRQGRRGRPEPSGDLRGRCEAASSQPRVASGAHRIAYRPRRKAGGGRRRGAYRHGGDQHRALKNAPPGSRKCREGKRRAHQKDPDPCKTGGRDLSISGSLRNRRPLSANLQFNIQ